MILFIRDLALTKNCRLGRWSPANSGYRLGVSSDFNSVRPLVSLVFYRVNFALGGTSSEDESVFPRCPGNAVDSSLGKYFVSLNPLTYLLLLPDTDFPVIAAGSNDIFILRMSP